MRCAVGSDLALTPLPPVPTLALPLSHDNSDNIFQHYSENDAENIRRKSEDELRLVGDLATAQVGQTKRFSIDAPKVRHGKAIPECNVIVTGLFLF